MGLHDPYAIFTATSNIEAQEVRLFLEQSGVEAHVTEDVSVVGLWMGGTLPGIHTPRVWVSRSEAEQAAELIRESRWGARETTVSTDSRAEGDYEENQCLACGSTFPEQAAECPTCGWTFAADEAE